MKILFIRKKKLLTWPETFILREKLVKLGRLTEDNDKRIFLETCFFLGYWLGSLKVMVSVSGTKFH